MSEFDRYGGGEYERALEHAISIGGQDAGFYNEVKAKRQLGWKPTVTFDELVQRLVDAEVERLRGERQAASSR